MPYITQSEREKYQPIINKVLSSIDGSPMEQANYFSFFIDYLRQALRKIADPGFLYLLHFGAGTGREAKLREYAEQCAKILPGNMEVRAGELNYVLSTIAWGLLGDAPGRKPARYCMRSFIKGAIWRVLFLNLNSFNGEEYILFTGVLTDVIDEMYRRKTSFFETEKMNTNGDLWSDIHG